MSNALRIALVAPLVTTIAQPYVGGAQAMLGDLAQGLQRRGHHVTLFAREGSFLPDVALELIAVPSSVLPASFAHAGRERPTDTAFFEQANIFLDLCLQLRLRHTEFDLVHFHAFDWPAFSCSASIQEIPVVHTVHLSSVSPEINTALSILHRRQHPLCLVTVSQSCAHTYADYTPFDHIIYNGLDLDAIPFASTTSMDAPLLIAGRITPEKGTEEAIEIAVRAGCALLIAGGIYDQRYFDQRIGPRLVQYQGQVTYLGELEHSALWQYMAQARGLLFPICWNEPFGLAPVEAMATGTPVIAFRNGAVEEIIIHGKTGFLVDAGDCEQAATYVADLHTLSRALCRKHVETHFSLERMLDAYEQLYLALPQKA